jgi:putative addiction module killer protein
MGNQESEVRTYEAVDGTVPFNEWIKALRDRKGLAVIRTRISRLQLGLFGDAKSVGEGVNDQSYETVHNQMRLWCIGMPSQ